MFRIFRLTLFIAFFASNTLAVPCSEDDAYNKMMALNRAAGRMMNTGNNPNSPGLKLTMESGALSEMIAAKKFNEACSKADELAKKFAVDLKQESAGMLTMEQLRKDGGKGSGKCSQADASKKMMELHQQLQDRVDSGDVDQEAFRQFNKDTANFGELLLTNPSAMCAELDQLSAKYLKASK